MRAREDATRDQRTGEDGSWNGKAQVVHADNLSSLKVEGMLAVMIITFAVETYTQQGRLLR
jgi:hypothetical protein